MAGRPVRRAREGRAPAPGARGYSWPPFEEGNVAALKHGAESPRRVAPIAARLLEELPVVAPWVDRDAFAGACRSWSWCEAQLMLVREYLDANGLLTAEGEERPAVRLLSQLETRAGRLREQLGLSPLAMAKLLSMLASVAAAGGGGGDDALDQLKAEGAAMLAARAEQPSESGG